MVLESHQELAEVTKIDAKLRPRAENSSFLRAARSQTDFRSRFARFSFDRLVFGRVVQGSRSQRISVDIRFERAKPDPHETLPMAINPEERPLRSESARSSEELRKTTKTNLQIDTRSASAVSDEKPRKLTLKSTKNR